MDLQEQLIHVATDLFLKYGIKSISMEDISRQMGISKKTLYSIIESKSDLVRMILERHLMQNERDLKSILDSSKDAIDEMLQMSTHILNFITHMSPSIIYDLQKYHPQCWKMIQDDKETHVSTRIYNNLVRGQGEMLYRTDFNPAIITRLYINKATSITDQRVFPLIEFDRALLFKEITKYHLFGIISEKGLKSILRNYRKFFSI